MASTCFTLIQKLSRYACVMYNSNPQQAMNDEEKHTQKAFQLALAEEIDRKERMSEAAQKGSIGASRAIGAIIKKTIRGGPDILQVSEARSETSDGRK